MKNKYKIIDIIQVAEAIIFIACVVAFCLSLLALVWTKDPLWWFKITATILVIGFMDLLAIQFTPNE